MLRKQKNYGTRAANAARINSAICFLQLSKRVLSVAMRFTVRGDDEHYTVGANTAFLRLLVHVLPFAILLRRVSAGIFFPPLHMFGQLLPVTEHLLQFAEILRFTAVMVQEGISPFDAVPLGANSLSIRFGRTHLFYSWSWYYTTLFKAVGVVVTRSHRSYLQQSALL